jgi:hypothetical protein
VTDQCASSDLYPIRDQTPAGKADVSAANRRVLAQIQGWAKAYTRGDIPTRMARPPTSRVGWLAGWRSSAGATTVRWRGGNGALEDPEHEQEGGDHDQPGPHHPGDQQR